ncbi:hypothetical protein DPMN_123759 [Dreissena polymorpha]|uniref:Uncharacterized protein n=1 Tax=Dreissena polymorpha TaxID=45954 RepID=A0A9D4JRK9_DREPO|nr:hypothetical protein DPMN_123759 [Dreissena polymorpha]
MNKLLALKPLFREQGLRQQGFHKSGVENLHKPSAEEYSHGQTSKEHDDERHNNPNQAA